jgi:hypothetical protein
MDLDSSDTVRTAAFAGGVGTKPSNNGAEDSTDSADEVLRSSAGNGPTSDFDAVLEDLAARGK